VVDREEVADLIGFLMLIEAAERDIEQGRVRPAKECFEEFRRNIEARGEKPVFG